MFKWREERTQNEKCLANDNTKPTPEGHIKLHQKTFAASCNFGAFVMNGGGQIMKIIYLQTSIPNQNGSTRFFLGKYKNFNLF